MTRRWTTLLLALVLVAVGLLLSPPSERTEKTGIVKGHLERAGRMPSHPVPTPTAEPPSGPEILELAPSTSTLREEAARNPHLPPPSLLRFSEQVNDRTDAVLSDETQSQDLLRQYSDCATQSGLSSSVQVICLFQADRISRVYPSCLPAFEQMRDRAAPETRRIFEMIHKR